MRFNMGYPFSITYEDLEIYRAKMRKIKQIDMALLRIKNGPQNHITALKAKALERDKLSIRRTFPKPTLVTYD